MHPRISPRLLPESECKGTTFFWTGQTFGKLFLRKMRKKRVWDKNKEDLGRIRAKTNTAKCKEDIKQRGSRGKAKVKQRWSRGRAIAMITLYLRYAYGDLRFSKRCRIALGYRRNMVGIPKGYPSLYPAPSQLLGCSKGLFGREWYEARAKEVRGKCVVRGSHGYHRYHRYFQIDEGEHLSVHLLSFVSFCLSILIMTGQVLPLHQYHRSLHR